MDEWDVVLKAARQQGDKDELLKEAAAFLTEQQLTPLSMRGLSQSDIEEIGKSTPKFPLRALIKRAMLGALNAMEIVAMPNDGFSTPAKERPMSAAALAQLMNPVAQKPTVDVSAILKEN